MWKTIIGGKRLENLDNFLSNLNSRLSSLQYYFGSGFSSPEARGKSALAGLAGLIIW
jgi:hypothetical protein